ncbi:helix-turn-helix domain-containing protein [Kitasatospora sp. NPDC096147]|uniref:helix-turn-helix domain-containing protein n=1 Tax=Kitasatospora sp. NPDC096147 TaxID=3364093 RepID=UPI0037F5B72B
MIVGDLLDLADLHIEAAWAPPELLAVEVTGVTSTDLQDPARYLQRGELVLTGLVWWRPEDGPAATSAALRFANALRSAGAAALLAGEGTHGAVPPELAEACRLHGVPLLSVPAGTSFRSVTDRVYLRLWGELGAPAEGAAALPAAVRRDLLALLAADARAGVDGPSGEGDGVSGGLLNGSSGGVVAGGSAGGVTAAGAAARAPGGVLGEVLARAVNRLGLPGCALLTGSGRVLAASSVAVAEEVVAAAGAGRGGGSVPVGPPGDTPFDGWQLRTVAEPGPAVRTVLDGLAELLAPSAARARATTAAQRRTAARLVGLLGPDGGPGLAEALTLCRLPARTALAPVVVRAEGTPEGWAVAVLAEALHLAGLPFAAAPEESYPAAGWSEADVPSAGGRWDESFRGGPYESVALEAAPSGAAPSGATLGAVLVGGAQPGGVGRAATPFAVGPAEPTSARTARPQARRRGRGVAVALVAAPADEVTAALRAVWPRFEGLLAGYGPLRAGVGPAVGPVREELVAALVQARYALASGAGGAVGCSAELGSLAALLGGIPAEVRAAFRWRLLAPLVAHDRANPVSLLDTLDTFLRHNASWSRTAEALHIHVNTVHYRIRRIEELTGRSLTRLEHRLDLRAALLCTPEEG